jgi:hypothetical protein
MGHDRQPALADLFRGSGDAYDVEIIDYHKG